MKIKPSGGFYEIDGGLIVKQNIIIEGDITNINGDTVLNVVEGAVENNIATFKSDGTIKDSGYNVNNIPIDGGSF